MHFKEEFELLKTIPPVKDSASVIIAEMGVNMDLFPTEAHLSSWAGMSPGNNESAQEKFFNSGPVPSHGVGIGEKPCNNNRGRSILRRKSQGRLLTRI